LFLLGLGPGRGKRKGAPIFRMGKDELAKEQGEKRPRGPGWQQKDLGKKKSCALRGLVVRKGTQQQPRGGTEKKRDTFTANRKKITPPTRKQRDQSDVGGTGNPVGEGASSHQNQEEQSFVNSRKIRGGGLRKPKNLYSRGPNKTL